VTDAVRVHHVVVYGPPASGKLSVAQAVARRTGARVLHSHLTTDLVTEIVDREAPGFWELVKALRLHLSTVVASLRIDLVSTTAFIPADQTWISEFGEALAAVGAQVHFVQLRPSLVALEQRVRAESRRQHGKLTSVESLRSALAEADYFARIGDEDLSIDNTALSPDEVAARIVSHCKLVP